MVFNTANSHKEVGDGLGAQKGFTLEDMGSWGRKPSMLCGGGGGETAVLLVVNSVQSRFPCDG